MCLILFNGDAFDLMMRFYLILIMVMRLILFNDAFLSYFNNGDAFDFI
ncbi:hypothetical protein E5E17_04885 [Helicobacter pylori]|nr:hypothetical protein E5E17_04885 [Helicobacter pylori]